MLGFKLQKLGTWTKFFLEGVMQKFSRSIFSSFTADVEQKLKNNNNNNNGNAHTGHWD